MSAVTLLQHFIHLILVVPLCFRNVFEKKKSLVINDYYKISQSVII